MTKLSTEKLRKMASSEYSPTLQSPMVLFGGKRMSSAQFETMKEQLKMLTPQQLRSLQGEINQSLETTAKDILSDEERNMLSSLFS